jgi:hypothetical protein
MSAGVWEMDDAQFSRRRDKYRVHEQSFVVALRKAVRSLVVAIGSNERPGGVDDSVQRARMAGHRRSEECAIFN